MAEQTITEWLTARLDEDAAAARAAEADAGPTWEHRDGLIYRTDDVSHYPGALISGVWGDLGDEGAHIARHDPARVLREVAAKRAILELADEATGLDLQVDLDRRVGPRDAAEEPYIGEMILRQMAQAYPDCPRKWRQ